MGMTDTSINAFNEKIRGTEWYQAWFAQRGLNPNQVKLNDQQRAELQNLIQQKAGFQFPKDMQIDPAGNLNEKGGWAGLPTGVKIAIIAGATIATAGAAGAFAGGAGAVSGASGAGSTAIGTGMGIAPSLAGSTAAGIGSMGAGAGIAAGTGAAAAGTGGSFLSALGGSKGVMSGISMAGKLASGAAAQRAQDRGAETEFDYLNNQNYNNAMQSRTGQQNTQALQYATARTTAEQNRMRQIGSADMLGNSKPPSDPRARVSGAGYMNPETIAMMRDRALKALESGSDVPEPTAIPEYRETSMAQPTKTDSFLKTLGMASTGLGAWDEWRRRQQPEEAY